MGVAGQMWLLLKTVRQLVGTIKATMAQVLVRAVHSQQNLIGCGVNADTRLALQQVALNVKVT